VFLREEQDNKLHSLTFWKKAATWLAAFFMIGAICFELGFRVGASGSLAQASGGKQVASSSQAQGNNASLTATQTDNLASQELVSVYVTGFVEHPGVYTVQVGKRIDDVVAMAVPKNGADLAKINLAAKVSDEMMIYVPKEGEEQPSLGSGKVGVSSGVTGNSAASSSSTSVSSLININTADAGQLDSLPGIGPTLAQRIIDYRQANGPFKTIDEIKNVSGIGDKKFEDIKGLITVR
jgi:competence protein ComEA